MFDFFLNKGPYFLLGHQAGLVLLVSGYIGIEELPVELADFVLEDLFNCKIN